MSVISKLFKPSGKRFYDLFEEVGSNMQEMSRLMVQVVYEPNAAVYGPLIVEMSRLEHKSDLATHRLFIELGKNFVTPFDREDIHGLAGTLDDIIDYMLSNVKMIQSYNLLSPNRTSQNVATGVQKIAKLLAVAVSQLKNKKSLDKLHDECMQIKKLSQSLDGMVDNAIAGLFADQDSPVLLIKMMGHYGIQQTLIAKCHDAADVLESIIIKYS
ncbi:MAG: DUF47 family protein [Sphingobacteriales bacterium]|nr:MAG: DUF47 family protein [Sphingobacteriales bacterium]